MKYVGFEQPKIVEPKKSDCTYCGRDLILNPPAPPLVRQPQYICGAPYCRVCEAPVQSPALGKDSFKDDPRAIRDMGSPHRLARPELLHSPIGSTAILCTGRF